MKQPRKRIGLALSGGVVRGMAHLGVLNVLMEAGIPIDVVAGTSAGSLMGLLVAAGFSPVEMYRHAAEMSWRRIARPTLCADGLLTFDPLQRWLTEIFGDIHFADLPKPFACVAADLTDGSAVVLRDGPVIPAVRASSSVPGIITPTVIDGRPLGDGSIVDNLPVNVARDLGADFVIGVDIFVPSFDRRRLGPLRYGVAAIELMVDRAGGGHNDCDCLIRPDLAGVTYVNFGARDDLFRRGAVAAQAALPTLQRVLALP
jgi:NTE family protein